MLGFEHGVLEGMGPVGKANLVVILFHLLNSRTLCPREFHRLGGAAEVVLHVALAAHLRLLIEASLLLERLADGGRGPVGIGTGEVQGGFPFLNSFEAVSWQSAQPMVLTISGPPFAHMPWK